MKSNHLLFPVLITTTLCFSGSLLAQNQSMPEQMPPGQQTASTSGSTQFTSPRGEHVTVESSMPAVPSGPAPSFEQLSGGAKFITESQAAAYPPLANDFLYANRNHNGRLNKGEYELWLKQR
ncbi:hypothetical protein [Dyella silvatica]|uniref:hypothetical protein n=1 Tax=Dyella silvatica TaxID=2992128 RepID=UPI002257FF44|nr:hypothetical protein [Dyella silvatica]